MVWNRGNRLWISHTFQHIFHSWFFKPFLFPEITQLIDTFKNQSSLDFLDYLVEEFTSRHHILSWSLSSALSLLELKLEHCSKSTCKQTTLATIYCIYTILRGRAKLCCLKITPEMVTKWRHRENPPPEPPITDHAARKKSYHVYWICRPKEMTKTELSHLGSRV